MAADSQADGRLKSAAPTADQAATTASDAPPAAERDRPTIPRELPTLPVRNMVVFPGTVVPLSIGREKSRRLIDAVLAGDKLLAVFTQRNEDVEDPGINDVYRVGTACAVLKLLSLPDGTKSLLVHGLVRIGLEEFAGTEPYWRALVNVHEDDERRSLELDALAYTARQSAEQIIELSPNVPEEARIVLDSIERTGLLADFLAANLSLGVVQKQELLETFDIADRLRKVNVTLNNQLEVLQLSQKIQTDVRSQIDKSQREYFLHEQMKAIQKELGEVDARSTELADLKKRIAAARMPEAVAAEAERELGRLERIPQASPEYGLIQDYLGWLCDMPWSRQTEDQLDLARAERILDEDHYGLEKVKRRILEYLAVRQLNPEGRGSILCFVGPPGVGKTSLGQSIARALGRSFIRIALGGVRDEADIRGHRRTYIGAIPGRLVQEIRKAGSRNPVLMLDELDKVGADFRGDPAAALLEVLDPAQNSTFTDHYLGVPFDLSRVFFIGTANYLDPVAPALRDRMELIDLPGYTTAEKLEIAGRYLVPRQLRENGLSERGVQFEPATLRAIVERYTREAGVRNLERMIGGVARGLAAKIARRQTPRLLVQPPDLGEYLGPPRFDQELAQRAGVPGVATGLAYTPVGGEIIFVEATRMPGRGGFTLTGQIGDVMRESALAALSLLRSRAKEWRVPIADLAESDLHVHVPAGGVPKDGPSAGVAMLAALYSLLSGHVVDPQVGMTGEITLRGLILPIGGVKEKVLAAHRAGLKTVVLPRRNEPDLEEIPADVRAELRFILADKAEDLLNAVMTEDGKTTSRAAERRRKPRTAREEGQKGQSPQRVTPAKGRRNSRSGKQQRAARSGESGE